MIKKWYLHWQEANYPYEIITPVIDVDGQAMEFASWSQADTYMRENFPMMVDMGQIWVVNEDGQKIVNRS